MYIKEIKKMYEHVLFFLILQKIPALCTVVWHLITLYLFLQWSSSFLLPLPSLPRI